MSIVLDFIGRTVPPSWKTNATGWHSGNCPMCVQNGQPRPDKKKRGGYMFEDSTFRYHCFNCTYTATWDDSKYKSLPGKLKKLLRAFGADDADIHRLQIELMRERDTARLLINEKPREHHVIRITWPEVELPTESHELVNFPVSDFDSKMSEKKFVNACQFLIDKKIDDYPKWYYSTYSHYKNRIILPFYYKNKIVGYAARWIGDTPNKETPKYLLKQPQNFVYGLDEQTKEREFVIVTEGQIDALCVGGVAVGSNSLSNDQAKIIEQLEKRIILVPDADKAGLNLVKQAIARGWSISFPPWEGCKDVHDAYLKYGKLFTVKTIIDFAVDNLTKAEILAKQYCR